MINPKELRLGNFVYFKNDTYSDRENKIEKYIFTVCLIAEDMVKINIGFGAVQRFEKKPIFSPPLQFLKPVALNEKWLFYFEFKKEEKIGKHFYKNCPKGDFDIAIDKDKFYYYADCWIELKYVHQLQNLFFDLIGDELTLKK